MQVLSEIEKVRKCIDAGVKFHESALKRGTKIHEKLERTYDDIFCSDCGLEWVDCGCGGTTLDEIEAIERVREEERAYDE